MIMIRLRAPLNSDSNNNDNNNDNDNDQAKSTTNNYNNDNDSDQVESATRCSCLLSHSHRSCLQCPQNTIQPKVFPFFEPNLIFFYYCYISSSSSPGYGESGYGSMYDGEIPFCSITIKIKIYVIIITKMTS